MSNEPPKKPVQKKISIELPKELNGLYSNVAFITHTQTELVFDFVQLLPHAPKGRVVSRIIMSPIRAKMLQLALTQNLANYERQFGELKVPQQPHLADQLFRFPPDKEQEGEK